MTIAIFAKNKIWFKGGSCAKPDAHMSLLQQRGKVQCCCSLLDHEFSVNCLVESVLKNLTKRFDKINCSRILEYIEKLNFLLKGTQLFLLISVNMSFVRMKFHLS